MTETKKLGAWLPLLKTAGEQGRLFDNGGADFLMAEDLSTNDRGHEESIGLLKRVIRGSDAPFMAGGQVKRVEDVKKYLYAGAKIVYLKASQPENIDLLKEVSDRFGKEKIAVWLDTPKSLSHMEEYDLLGAGSFLVSAKDFRGQSSSYPVYLLTEEKTEKELASLLSGAHVSGVILTAKTGESSFMELKTALKADGLSMDTLDSSVCWKELKLGPDGLIPVIVQDYRTNEVLMMAYMDEPAFDETLRTGKMCYYSRSRKSRWLKGETSGHFQYVKSLHLDCDNDTILAKVFQVGGACHTGSRSCFFQTLVKKEYDETNPLMVFEKVYDIIKDRKLHPKEGSYTNYLFDKGIDKILKKVGEEATEIIIAAKNPDPEEIIYELSDFLYHAMVLMAEKGVTWEDIMKELANR